MARAVSKEDQTLFNLFAKGRLLISIIFLGTAIICFVIWVKRQILRVQMINRKGPLEQAGSYASKELRKEIEDNFKRISEMRLEPKLLSDQGQHEPLCTTLIEEIDDSSFKYRRKAFDLMSCLDEVLSRVNISLARKPSQSVREHLIALQSPPYAPFEGEAHAQLCEEVTRLYEHARYGLKEFNEEDYILYSSKVDQLYDRVHQKLVVPGSLVIHSDHNPEHMETQFSDDQILESEPLLPSVLVESRNSVLRNRDGSKHTV